MSAVINENTQWLSDGGKPLVGGLIYIGDVGADPVANPKSIFSNRQLTNALANPQTIAADGRSENKIWLSGRYSIQVNDANGTQVFQDLDAGVALGALSATGLTNVLGGDTITAEGSPTVAALTDKATYVFTAVAVNTGAVTMNIDSVGAKPVRKNQGLNLAEGEIQIGDILNLQYNASTDEFSITNQKTNEINFRSISGNSTIVTFDSGALIRCTATLTLAAQSAASLGAGFSVFVRADGGDVTIDPDGSETIDGAATLLLEDGTWVLITSDGTNWQVVTPQPPLPTTPTIQVFTSSGTWNRPTGCRKIKVTVTGGGAGGGATNVSLETAAGGGAGGTAISYIDVTSLASETVTVGAGGNGQTGAGTGGAGAQSSFGSSVVANGGSGGGGSAGPDNGGTGGSATNGDILIKGGDGGSASLNTNIVGGTGGASYFGGGGRGTGVNNSSGLSGSVGSGGGGGMGNGNGGNGGDGIVIVEEYY